MIDPEFIQLTPNTIAMLSKIGLIILLTLLGQWGIKLIFGFLEKKSENALAGTTRLSRLLTILRLARSTTIALVFLLAGMMILQALDINITPILASAGVVGLALSLGTQTLVKDIIGGILILVEDQFEVGDSVQVGEVSGAVESITLRTTSLRDLQGRLHIIPNGDIRTLTNSTTEWSRAVVELNLAYDTDIKNVVRILENALEQAQNDPDVREELLETPQAVGWVGMNDWAVQVRLMSKTKPGSQLAVANKFRQYALDALNSAGIDMALPRQALTVQDRESVARRTKGDA